MKVQYYTAQSLDGFVATEDHSLDWLMGLGDPEVSSFAEFDAGVGALVIGSKTYEWLLDNHVYADPAAPRAWPHAKPAFVFTSRALRAPEGADLHFVQGPVAAVHDRVLAAAGGRNVWVAGGGDLAGQYFDAGLLDEVIVQIAAVTLGRGVPVLPREIVDPPLRLTSVAQIGDAFAELRFAVPRRSTR